MAKSHKHVSSGGRKMQRHEAPYNPNESVAWAISSGSEHNPARLTALLRDLITTRNVDPNRVHLFYKGGKMGSNAPSVFQVAQEFEVSLTYSTLPKIDHFGTVCTTIFDSTPSNQLGSAFRGFKFAVLLNEEDELAADAHNYFMEASRVARRDASLLAVWGFNPHGGVANTLEHRGGSNGVDMPAGGSSDTFELRRADLNFFSNWEGGSVADGGFMVSAAVFHGVFAPALQRPFWRRHPDDMFGLFGAVARTRETVFPEASRVRPKFVCSPSPPAPPSASSAAVDTFAYKCLLSNLPLHRAGRKNGGKTFDFSSMASHKYQRRIRNTIPAAQLVLELADSRHFRHSTLLLVVNVNSDSDPRWRDALGDVMPSQTHFRHRQSRTLLSDSRSSSSRKRGGVNSSSRRKRKRKVERKQRKRVSANRPSRKQKNSRRRVVGGGAEVGSVCPYHKGTCFIRHNTNLVLVVGAYSPYMDTKPTTGGKRQTLRRRLIELGDKPMHYPALPQDHTVVVAAAGQSCAHACSPSSSSSNQDNGQDNYHSHSPELSASSASMAMAHNGRGGGEGGGGRSCSEPLMPLISRDCPRLKALLGCSWCVEVEETTVFQGSASYTNGLVFSLPALLPSPSSDKVQPQASTNVPTAAAQGVPESPLSTTQPGPTTSGLTSAKAIEIPTGKFPAAKADPSAGARRRRRRKVEQSRRRRRKGKKSEVKPTSESDLQEVNQLDQSSPSGFQELKEAENEEDQNAENVPPPEVEKDAVDPAGDEQKVVDENGDNPLEMVGDNPEKKGHDSTVEKRDDQEIISPPGKPDKLEKDDAIEGKPGDGEKDDAVIGYSGGPEAEEDNLASAVHANSDQFQFKQNVMDFGAPPAGQPIRPRGHHKKPGEHTGTNQLYVHNPVPVSAAKEHQERVKSGHMQEDLFDKYKFHHNHHASNHNSARHHSHHHKHSSHSGGAAALEGSRDNNENQDGQEASEDAAGARELDDPKEDDAEKQDVQRRLHSWRKLRRKLLSDAHEDSLGLEAGVSEDLTQLLHLSNALTRKLLEHKNHGSGHTRKSGVCILGKEPRFLQCAASYSGPEKLQRACVCN